VSGDTSLATAVPAGLTDLGALRHRARCNAAARRGEYTESIEHELVT
jgi:hypothetical protein